VSTICLPDAGASELLGELPAGIETVVWDGSGPPPPGSEHVGLLVAPFAPSALPAKALLHLPALRVIQLLSAGAEPWLGRVPDGVVLCNARGAHGGSTAELALAGLFSLLKQLPTFGQAQRAHDWARAETDGLAGKRVLILGAGDIGARIAAVSEILGAQVTFVGRRARPGVRGPAELPELLARHDVVIVALPHTPETVNLVDAAFLAAMPDGAILVNIARGPIVDTDALVAELMAGRLHAFLDVTEPEPLPTDHPLWDAPNLVLTPHVGGATYGWQSRAYQLVRDQVVRFHQGQPLENVVSEGY